MPQIKILKHSALKKECKNTKLPLMIETVQKSEADISGIFVFFSFVFLFPSPIASCKILFFLKEGRGEKKASLLPIRGRVSALLWPHTWPDLSAEVTHYKCSSEVPDPHVTGKSGLRIVG